MSIIVGHNLLQIALDDPAIPAPKHGVAPPKSCSPATTSKNTSDHQGTSVSFCLWLDCAGWMFGPRPALRLLPIGKSPRCSYLRVRAAPIVRLGLRPVSKVRTRSFSPGLATAHRCEA